MWRFSKPKSSSQAALENGVYDRFKAILHPKQLVLFHEVLQYSLVRARSHIVKQISNHHTHEIVTSFEQIQETLYVRLQRLNTLLKEKSSWQQHSHLNLFLTIVVFYRILLNPASQQSYGDNHAIQRIPPKLFYLLGSEYWRLFELQTLLFDDMEKISANVDLLPLLTTLFPAPPLKADELANTHVEQEAAQPHDEVKVLALFAQWLEGNLLRKEKAYQINEGYVFVDTLRFDTHTVFITHDGIKAFFNVHREVSEENLYQALQNASESQNHYCLAHLPIDLFAIKIHLDVEQFDILTPVTILEKPHAD